MWKRLWLNKFENPLPPMQIEVWGWWKEKTQIIKKANTIVFVGANVNDKQQIRLDTLINWNV